jgi:filamin
VYTTVFILNKSCFCVSLSPFEVEVSEEVGPQKVRAWGPGLLTGQVGKSADFVVEAIGTEVGTLGKSGHEGPGALWVM